MYILSEKKKLHLFSKGDLTEEEVVEEKGDKKK